jgi:hypothetical protein
MSTRSSSILFYSIIAACSACVPKGKDQKPTPANHQLQPPMTDGADIVKQSALKRGQGGGLRTHHHRAVTPAGAVGIGYSGGRVMLGTPELYIIWYGNWANNTARTIIPEYLSHLGNSPYLLINQQYCDSQGGCVSGNVHYAASTDDNYSQGTSLGDTGVEAIVDAALARNALPKNENAIYLVLTSADVSEGAFCSGYCGWHTNGQIQNADIKYAFLGDPGQCGSGCGVNSPSPNNNGSADSLVSTISHEVEESLTDPDLDAWGDQNGENADKCAWTFGATYTTSNGSEANLRLDGHDYLIQENWDPSTGQCEIAAQGSGGGTMDAGVDDSGTSGGGDAAQNAPDASTVGSDASTGPDAGTSGLVVQVRTPSPGTTFAPGGTLDIVASVTDDTSNVADAVVEWTYSGGTMYFDMNDNGDGTWELLTTISSYAVPGPRSFVVTGYDDVGNSVSTSAVNLTVH